LFAWITVDQACGVTSEHRSVSPNAGPPERSAWDGGAPWTERTDPLPPRFERAAQQPGMTGDAAPVPTSTGHLPPRQTSAGYVIPGQFGPSAKLENLEAGAPGSPGIERPRPSGPTRVDPMFGGPASPGYQPAGRTSPFGGSHVATGAAAIPPRRSRLVRAALVLAALLTIIVVGQTYFIVRLGQRQDRAEQAALETRKQADARMRGLETRANALETQAGKALDAAAVATDVTPSVFRVVAGDFSGTAFAIGKEPTGGGTDLLTNFHVVEELYDSGGRNVALERDNKRYTAKIVKVGHGKDIALLHANESFPRLQSASASATQGQPVVVVGAPLGLEDTVTTGVVSALRETADGPVVQFDAPINPGNSGGPVVNAQKQVVGIATAKANAAEGIGLAIPIAIACDTFANC
jgi:putative serine protease PepD